MPQVWPTSKAIQNCWLPGSCLIYSGKAREHERSGVYPFERNWKLALILFWMAPWRLNRFGRLSNSLKKAEWFVPSSELAPSQNFGFSFWKRHRTWPVGRGSRLRENPSACLPVSPLQITLLFKLTIKLYFDLQPLLWSKPPAGRRFVPQGGEDIEPWRKSWRSARVLDGGRENFDCDPRQEQLSRQATAVATAAAG